MKPAATLVENLSKTQNSHLSKLNEQHPQTCGSNTIPVPHTWNSSSRIPSFTLKNLSCSAQSSQYGLFCLATALYNLRLRHFTTTAIWEHVVRSARGCTDSVTRQYQFSSLGCSECNDADYTQIFSELCHVHVPVHARLSSSVTWKASHETQSRDRKINPFPCCSLLKLWTGYAGSTFRAPLTSMTHASK